jgi:hypothetical protein
MVLKLKQCWDVMPKRVCICSAVNQPPNKFI